MYVHKWSLRFLVGCYVRWGFGLTGWGDEGMNRGGWVDGNGFLGVFGGLVISWSVRLVDVSSQFAMMSDYHPLIPWLFPQRRSLTDWRSRDSRNFSLAFFSFFLSLILCFLASPFLLLCFLPPFPIRSRIAQSLTLLSYRCGVGKDGCLLRVDDWRSKCWSSLGVESWS